MYPLVISASTLVKPALVAAAMRLLREMRRASGRCMRRCSTKSGGSDLPGIGTYEAVMPSSEHLNEANRYSSVITQRKSQGAGQAQLYATDVGKIAGGMKKTQVGISSVWYEGNPCNMHLLEVAGCVKTSVQALDMVGLRFNSIGVSDGISNGTDGMAYSLQSRDLIADGIETVMGAQFYDANISVPRHVETQGLPCRPACPPSLSVCLACLSALSVWSACLPARPAWPASISAAHAAASRGSLRHALVLREASGEPAGQGVSPPCFRPAQVPGCDKNMPGCLMAMARVNRPSVMVYGGTIRAGCRPDRTDDKLDIISAFEAYGKFTAGGSGTLESAALVAPLLARAPASPI